MRLPTSWKLPGGFRVEFIYVDRLEDAHGEWHGFEKKVGKILIEKGPLDEMADSVYHEMQHALTDWHAAYLRPMQRSFLKALLREAALQAEEKA